MQKICPSCAAPLRDETAVCSNCTTADRPETRAVRGADRLSRSNYATIAVITGSIGWVFMRAIPRAAEETLAAAGNAINADALLAGSVLAYGTWLAAACFAVAISLAVVALFAGPPSRR